MKILIVSDTHRKNENLEIVLEQVELQMMIGLNLQQHLESFLKPVYT